MGDILDLFVPDAPDPEPVAPPPPPPPPTDDTEPLIEGEDLDAIVRENARKAAQRRGRSSLIRDDAATSTPGGSGVSIL